MEIEEFRGFRQRIAQLHAANGTLAEESKRLKEQHEHLKQEVAGKDQELQRLRNNLATAKMMYQGNMQNSAKERAELASQLVISENAANVLRAENEELKYRLETLRKDMEQKCALVEAEAAEKHMSSEMAKYQMERDMEQLRCAVDSQKGLVAEVGQNFDDMHQVVKEKNVQLQRQSWEISSSKGREMYLAKRLSDSQQQYVQTKAELGDMKKEREAERARAVKRTPIPYGNLQNRDSKKKRLVEGIDALKGVAGACEGSYYRDLVTHLEKDGYIKTKLSDEESFIFYSAVGFTRRRFRTYKSFLRSHGILDPSTSLQSIIEFENRLGGSQYFEVVQHAAVDKSGNPTVITTVQLRNVRDFLGRRLTSLSKGGKLRNSPAVEVTIMGDLGGGEMKLTLAIGASDSPNSTKTLILLGCFDGNSEKVEDIQYYLQNIIRQLNCLVDVEFEVGDVILQKPVIQYLGGDLKFVCGMMGHQGCAASYNCYACFHQKGTREKIGNYKTGGAIARTDKDYADLSREAGKRNEPLKGVKPNSCFVFERVSVERVIFPSLHITMGIAQRYGFDYLLEWADEKDNGGAVPLRKEILKKQRKAKGDLLAAEQVIRKEKDELETLKMVRNACQNKIQKKIVESRQTTCQADICFFRDIALKNINREFSRQMDCDDCPKQLHAVCAGVWTQESLEETSDMATSVKCLTCRKKTIDQILVLVEKDWKLQEGVVADAEQHLKEKQADYDAAMQKRKPGTTRKELEAIWAQCGADMSAWQQRFTGNHTLKLLQPESVKRYMTLFSSHAQHDSMSSFLISLGTIQKLCVARIMTDIEKREMRQAIEAVWESLLNFASTDSVIPKLHMLMEHVMPFIEKYNTWALTSEQAVESMHAEVNRLKVLHRTTRNVEQKWNRIFKVLLFSTFANDLR